MAKVSVIVPNYNHAPFLEQRINSILSQTFQDFEIILLDDCSTDNSKEIIETYRGNEKVKAIILNEKNSGSAFVQWKKGIQASTGNYIWIAESDDFCDLNFLEIAVKKLEAGIDLFYAMTVNTDEAGNPRAEVGMWTDDLSKTRWRSDFENNSKDEVMEMLFLKNTIPNASAAVFRRTDKLISFLDQIQQMKYCGDWIFWMNYLLDVNRLYYSVESRNYFRNHAAVSRRTHSQEDRNEEILTVLRFILKNNLSNGKRKQIVQYFFRNHFYTAGKRNFFKNLNLASKQIFVSSHFIPAWFRFYLS